MSILRNVLGVIGACALLYFGVAGALGYGPVMYLSVSAGVCAACFIGIELCCAVQKDRDKTHDPVEIGKCMDCGQLAPLERLHRTGGTCLVCTPVPPWHHNHLEERS